MLTCQKVESWVIKASHSISLSLHFHRIKVRKSAKHGLQSSAQSIYSCTSEDQVLFVSYHQHLSHLAFNYFSALSFSPLCRRSPQKQSVFISILLPVSSKCTKDPESSWLQWHSRPPGRIPTSPTVKSLVTGPPPCVKDCVSPTCTQGDILSTHQGWLNLVSHLHLTTCFQSPLSILLCSLDPSRGRCQDKMGNAREFVGAGRGCGREGEMGVSQRRQGKPSDLTGLTSWRREGKINWQVGES